MITENTPFIAMCWIPAILVMPAKKMITIPRMGVVKFKSARKIKITKAAIVLLITGSFSFLVILFFTSNSILKAFAENYLVFLVGAVIAIPPLVGAILLNIKRYFLYTFLMFWTFGLEGFYQGSAPYNFLSLGIILTTTGSFILITFLKKYPKQNNS